MPASPSALGLLEIIALLFPVVALLLQLQHRAADSERVERFGFVAGIGLFALLSLSFVLVFTRLVVVDQPGLLALALGFTTLTSVLLPALLVLASETMVENALDLFPTDLGEYDPRPASWDLWPETDRDTDDQD